MGNNIPQRRKPKAQNGNLENLENPDSDELGTWVRNISEIKSYIYHLPEAVISNYQKTCNYAFYTNKLISELGMGQVVSSDDLMPYNEFTDSKIYQQHCRYFEMEQVLGLVSSIPGHMNQYIACYLFHSDPKMIFTPEETQWLDALAPTMILTGLYQMGRVHVKYMKNRSRLLGRLDNAPKSLKLLK